MPQKGREKKNQTLTARDVNWRQGFQCLRSDFDLRVLRLLPVRVAGVSAGSLMSPLQPEAHPSVIDLHFFVTGVRFRNPEIWYDHLHCANVLVHVSVFLFHLEAQRERLADGFCLRKKRTHEQQKLYNQTDD